MMRRCSSLGNRRRGTTLLFVIGMLAVMFIGVFALMTQTGLRYAQSRRFEDRIQALHVAQAGLIWARGEEAAGREIESRMLDLEPAGVAHLTLTGDGEERRLVVEGRVIREGEVMAARRLSMRWPEGARR